MEAVNKWVDAEWAERYLRDRGQIPHRMEGYAVVLELLAERVTRVLDLGTGDGYTLGLVLGARPEAHGFGIDFNPEMLKQARARFEHERASVQIIDHNLDEPLPAQLGTFDVVVSSFAIHHCAPDRQHALYAEVFNALEPGGVFINLEHVDSATPELHTEFLDAIGVQAQDDDPSNQLVRPEVQLEWLRGIGFTNVDCMWRWRELALLSGHRPE